MPGSEPTYPSVRRGEIVSIQHFGNPDGLLSKYAAVEVHFRSSCLLKPVQQSSFQLPVLFSTGLLSIQTENQGVCFNVPSFGHNLVHRPGRRSKFFGDVDLFLPRVPVDAARMSNLSVRDDGFRFRDAIAERNEPIRHRNNGEMGWHRLEASVASS